MISLKRILLNNIVVHKNTEFVFEPGITVIRGQNGSGKSILFNTISNVLNGSMPFSVKKRDSKSVHSKNSKIEIDFINQSSYKVIQQNNDKTLTYEIFKDGESVDPRTISIASEYLHKAFPVSPEIYFSLIHLLPYRGNIIRTGSGSQRKQFFEQLFNLKYSDDILTIIKSKLSDLKNMLERKTIYDDELKSLTFTENLDSLKETLLSVNKDFDVINTEYSKKSELLQKVSSINTLKGTLVTNQTLEDLLQYKIKFDNKLKHIRELKEDLQTKIKLYKENDLLIDQYNSLKVTLEDTKFSVLTKTTEEYQNIINKINQIIPDKEKFYQNALENNAAYDKMRALEQTVNLLKTKFDSYDDALQKISNAVSETQKQNALITKLMNVADSTECPLCGSPLNKDDIAKLIDNARRIIKDYSDLLLNKETILSYYKLREQNIEFIDVKPVLDKLTSLREKLALANDRLALSKEKERLELQFNSLPKIQVLDKPDESKLKLYGDAIEKGESMILNVNKDIDTFNYINKLENDLLEYGSIDCEKFANDNKELVNKLTELSRIKADLSSKITLAESDNEKIVSINEKLDKIEKETVDFPIYEALVKAYGPKGIKIDQIKYIAEAFCANLNKYSSLLFSKKINFSVNVDNTNFNIYYEIDNRQISDVCTMSGAESRLFMLLCLISLLPFIPENLRCDTVILDEIESGMSDSTRKFVSENFYKELLNIVPKIIIVTPMSQKEFFVNSDREYEIKLKDSVTQLERVL